MTIGSIKEMEQARAVLAGRPSAELADFILSLAFASDGISECVHAFALSADPKCAAEVVQAELRFLQKGERDSDYRYRKGSGYVARADRLLDTIERCVMPGDPGAAFQILTTFVESEEQICAHCWDDDFGASQLFERAWELTNKVAETLPATDADPVLERLRSGSASPVSKARR